MINNDDERRDDSAKANHYQNTSHSNRSVEAFFQHKLEKSAISRKFFRKELNFDEINADFFITHETLSKYKYTKAFHFLEFCFPFPLHFD